MNVSIKTCQCKLMEKQGGRQSISLEQPVSLQPSVISTEINYDIVFEGKQRIEKVDYLAEQIKVYKKREEHGVQTSKDQWKMKQLENRRRHMDSVWLFTNHVVFKSGKSLKYLPRTAKTTKKPQDFNIDLGHDVWV